MPARIRGVEYYTRDEVAELAGFMNGNTLSATLYQIPSRGYTCVREFPAHDITAGPGNRKFWRCDRKQEILNWKDWYERERFPSRELIEWI